MVDIATKNKFTEWVLRLDRQVATIETDFALGNVPGMARQVGTYQSEIRLLQDQATRQGIDILEYYDKFSSISSRLIVLTRKIETRVQGTQQQDKETWYNILSGISGVLSIIALTFNNPVLSIAIDRITLILLPSPVKPLIPQFSASLQERRSDVVRIGAEQRKVEAEQRKIRRRWFGWLDWLLENI